MRQGTKRPSKKEGQTKGIENPRGWMNILCVGNGFCDGAREAKNSKHLRKIVKKLKC